jgi:hypothetical protein
VEIIPLLNSIPIFSVVKLALCVRNIWECPYFVVALKKSDMDFIDAKLVGKLDAWVGNSMSFWKEENFN